MKEKELASVVENLGEALKILEAAGIEDKDIAQKFAVYLVALKLAEKGYEVRVPAEKGKKGRADIYIPYMNVKIEVKSGRRRYDCSTASFGDGQQIKQRKFDYCAFLTFRGNMVNEIFIFSLEELKEIAEKPRPALADYKGTNVCMLLKYDNLEEAEKNIRYFSEKLLNIEIELHKHPEKFLNRWDKIVT
jgi:hypothetical protein